MQELDAKRIKSYWPTQDWASCWWHCAQSKD